MFTLVLKSIIVSTACASSEVGDLDNPTTVTLRFDDRPLSEVLEALEDQTGLELTIESIQPDEQEIASRRISIDVEDRPFWEAVDLIADAANLELETVDRNRIVLARRRCADRLDCSYAPRDT